MEYDNISVGYENTELSHVVQERAEGPKAPSPGRMGKTGVFNLWVKKVGI